MRRTIIRISPILLSAAMAFAVAGCNKGQKPAAPADPSTPSQTTPTPSVSDDLTWEEFLRDHKQVAINFINNEIRPGALKGKDVVSENWAMTANEDNELSTVELSCVYKAGETSRVASFSKFILDDPIDLDDIVEGDYATVSVQSETLGSFTFDAKENYQKAELGTAIYNALNMQSDASNCFFTERQTSSSSTRGFDMINLNGSTAVVRSVEVYKGNSDQETIANLGDKSKIVVTGTKATYKMDGASVIAQNYVRETFTSQENPGPGGQENPGTGGQETPGSTIKDIQDLLQNHSAILNEALNENVYPEICNDVKNSVLKFAESKFSDSQWDFETKNDSITKINFTSHYKDSANGYIYYVYSATPASPIKINQQSEKNIKDSLSSSLKNVSVSKTYSFGYNPTVQNTKNDLVDAIFTANGIEKTQGAVRLFVDNGSSVDGLLGAETHDYKVLQITDNGIQEIDVRIKDASSDADLIKNLKDPTSYRVSAQESVSLGGEKLNYSNSAASNVSYVLVYDDNDLFEM